MKTKALLICLGIFFSSRSEAQYFTIPDPDFVTWLTAHYPACMNGNQMDTTCPDILSESQVYIMSEPVSDLTGLQYFTGIWDLTCGYNNLSYIPSFPVGIISIWLDHNNLTSLPVLPPDLEQLSCNYNNLTSLPNLPNSMTLLSVWNNSLTNLPGLPPNLGTFFCDNNNLQGLPDLPPNLQELSCQNNNISCFPVLPGTLTNSNFCGILPNPCTCLPNYVSGMNSGTLALPLCTNGDTVNNPNGCAQAEAIAGFTYTDSNGNCIKDSLETGVNNIHLQLNDTNYIGLGLTSSLSDGSFNFAAALGTFSVVIDTAGKPYTSQCAFPGMDSTFTLSAADPTITNINFDIVCKPGFDVGCQSVTRSGWVFPGLPHRLKILAGDISNWYNLSCAAGVSGTMQVTVNGDAAYSGITQGALTPNITGNVFTYTIPDFGAVDFQNDFGLMFIPDTTAQAWDTICVSVSITPLAGDNNQSNNEYNFCYNVLNSFDPNMKEVYPQDVYEGYQDWFTYTIHFQNTGNAPAMNIRLSDTLDNNLDMNTFELINYSHANTFHLMGNVLGFSFQNIFLPDSGSDFEGSQGFVQYRIKPKDNLQVGSQIKNKAFIYFDYNAPIITNTTTNNILMVVGQSLPVENNDLITFYPNPTTGKISLKKNPKGEATVFILNSLGGIVLRKSIFDETETLDLSNLSAGIYFLRVNSAKASTVKKLILSHH